MAGVFISYRRDDSPGHAGRVFDALRARLGSELVFMDVDAIDAGLDFVQALERAVGSCDALLAIIGPGWVSSVAHPAGPKRLNDPDDFVRFEIGTALKRDVRVVPVLVDNATLPTLEELPDELKGLTRRNAVELRDSRWDVDVNELVQSMETLITRFQRDHTGLRQRERTTAGSGLRSPVWRTATAMVLLGMGAIVGARGCLPDSIEERGAVRTGSDAALPSTSASGAASPDAAPIPAAQGAGARRTASRGVGLNWFGLWLDTVTDMPPGVIVADVVSGGPAANAGIMEKDVLVQVAGQSVHSFSAVADAVAQHVKRTPAGTPGVVHVVRNGVHQKFMVFFDREFVLSR